jgi:hypothetical protein
LANPLFSPQENINLMHLLDYNQAPFNQLAHLLSASARADLSVSVCPNWAEIEHLNQALSDRSGPAKLKFVAQNAQLLSDGLSFEQRIRARGEIATRADSLHDFYSGLMWLRFPKVKLAINAIHMHGINTHGTKMRSRHQQAVTHLDEAGAWVVSTDAALLELIDAHAWTELFLQQRLAWLRPQIRDEFLPSIEARVFGHAIFELMHAPHKLLAAKVVWIVADQSYFALSNAEKDAALDTIVANALNSTAVSGDPKLLSTLPLSGIPGWWPAQDAAFYASAPCFRPRPEARIYSPALRL